ncbi:MAG: zf-TFIIB domain-containing protein [Betaproteobacteria bacterium]|nr:zf-TFIIB domain-containing protein [Betaproteobacteria bacterium]
MMDLNCPKCRTAMNSFERSGVILEHCPECGGIFLDRGELERVIEAEAPGLPREASRPTPTTPAGGSDLLRTVMDLAKQYRGGGKKPW